MLATAPDYNGNDADRGLVPLSASCPNCGERRVTVLDLDGDTVTCFGCGCCYPFAPDLPALPATTAEAFAKAVSEAQQRGTKQVAAVGRILPHSRRRATGGGK